MPSHTLIHGVDGQRHFLQPRQLGLQIVIVRGRDHTGAQLMHQAQQNGLTQGGGITSQDIGQIGMAADKQGHFHRGR